MSEPSIGADYINTCPHCLTSAFDVLCENLWWDYNLIFIINFIYRDRKFDPSSTEKIHEP